MFLTTNRITSIDAAFKSRIDLILPYENLDESTRRKLWVNFIGQLSSGIAEISDSDFNQLASSDLKGREIKNMVKTALGFAARDPPLRMKHILTMLKIRERAQTLST